MISFVLLSSFSLLHVYYVLTVLIKNSVLRMTKTVCLNEYIVSVQYHIYLIGTLGFFISDRQMSIIVVKTYDLNV